MAVEDVMDFGLPRTGSGAAEVGRHSRYPGALLTPAARLRCARFPFGGWVDRIAAFSRAPHPIPIAGLRVRTWPAAPPGPATADASARCVVVERLGAEHLAHAVEDLRP